jgi:DNA helicase-2/ATP-dependent DNA helicase PcrA
MHENGPLLVVAGAGTGKTRVITERIRHLILDKNVKPHEILALTFTEKAAGEMLERIGDVMPLGYEEPWVYTFHSFADRILKSEGIEIGLDPSYKILSGPEQWLLLRKGLFKMQMNYFRPLGNPTKFISDALKFISRLQDENISPDNLREYVENSKDNFETGDEIQRWQELAHIYETYTKIKIEKSRLDFGDLITWTIKLFNDRPAILKKYQKQFRHVLVDEFQDTNYAQYILIKMLCPAFLGERSLVAVGDDSQSIYKFRGAAVSNILEFMRDYPDSEMVTLLQNYRSSQEILDPAYRLIQNNNPDTLESKLGISKKITSEANIQGESPEIIRTETLEEEVEFVVSKILEILAKEPGYTYKDFAILARANNHLDAFLLGLRQKGIPYQLVGNRGLYDRDEIRDIIALLKTVLNPNDPISLYRTLNISTLKIPYTDVAAILAKSRIGKEDLWETIKKSKSDSLQFFYQRILDFQKNITKSTPVEFVFSAVNSINYISQFTEEETIENQLAIENLDLFLNIVKKFEIDFHQEHREYPTLLDFVDYLELIIEAGDNPAQAEIKDIDTINLLTAHSAKGLEFPVVFLVNLVSDRFPTRNRKDAIMIPDRLIKETLPSGDEHIQEERRLFYVGMTRAKKYLYMTYGKDYGGKREKTPSGFLQEIGLDTKDPGKIKPDGETNTLFGINSGFRDSAIIKINGTLPESLSFSAVDNYTTCPLQYKYKYVLKLPTLPSHALSFGTTIHDTLRDFHTKLMFNKEVSLDDLLYAYENNWQPLGYMNEEHRKMRFENGKELLERYHSKHKNDSIKHIALEKRFSLNLGGIQFKGRIDRIDEYSDGVEIIDYKTGATKTQKEVDKDTQLALYDIAAREALKLNPKLLSLYFLEEGVKISTTHTPEELTQAKRTVIQVVERLKKGDYEATPGMHCTWCDYKDICPFVYKG